VVSTNGVKVWISSIFKHKCKGKKIKHCVCVVIKPERIHVANLAHSSDLFHYNDKPQYMISFASQKENLDNYLSPMGINFGLFF